MTKTPNLDLPQFVGTDPVKYTDFNDAFTRIDSVSPIGEIRMWPVPTPPPDFLLCDGSSIPKTMAPKLYDVIGTTFGTGVDVTEFRVPNFIGRVPVGVDTGDPNLNAAGSAYGEKEHKLTVSEIPAHSGHIPTFAERRGKGNAVGKFLGTGTLSTYGEEPRGWDAESNEAYPTSKTAGGNGAHNNMQPSLAIYFIIRYR